MKRAAAFRDGSKALAQSARPGVVALTIAKHAPIFALLCLPPALWAWGEGEQPLAIALTFPGLAALAVYGISLKRPLPADLRGIEAIVTVAIVFCLSALLITPAFMTLGMPAVDALFEAMSGATTTGLSVATNPDAWPFAAQFLRAWVQWLGGLVMATAVLALLLPSGLPARKLGQAGIDQGDRIASTRRQAQQLLGVYILLTAIMAVLTALAVPDWREGFVLTLSAISTAGFAPRSDSLASYAPLAQGLVIFTCVLGAVSLLSFVLILQRRLSAAWQLGSLRRVIAACMVFGTAYVAGLMVTESRSVNDIYEGVLNLISGLTTAGFSTGPMPAPGPALLIIIIAMLAGGDVGSTAGGIKLARIGVLLRAALHAFRQPSLPPNAVAPLRHDGEPVEDHTLIGLLALLLIYAAVLLLLWLQFLAHGHPALPALFEVVSTLSTVGLSTGLVSAELSTDLKLSLTFAMWLGRLEFIAVLLLLAPQTWTTRS
ncbi:hypothetical protein A8B78_11960 [Jannaschia sp. EhC01]|nr:hypothetical protein A8B78_11960 [Jannaschia sp. EhC01]